MRKTSVCIIGANFGINVHLKALKMIRNVNILGVAGKKNRRLKNISYYLNWKSMVDEIKPNLVIVSAPPNIQINILKYLTKKKINFLAEKPLSTSYKEVLLYKKKYKPRGFVDLNFLKINKIDKLKKIISLKHSGEKKVSILWNLKSDLKKNGGPILNFYFHLQSIIDYLFPNNKLNNFSREKSYKFNINYKTNNSLINVVFDPYKKKNYFKLDIKSKKNHTILVNKSYDYHKNFSLVHNNKIINFKNNSPIKKDVRVYLARDIISDIIKKKNSIKNFSIRKGFSIHEKINKFYDH